MHYDFIINYSPETKNLADALSQLLINKDAEKELVKQNCKILNKLQCSLSENPELLLNATCKAIIQLNIYDNNNYSREYCILILKILIVSTIAIPNKKKF